jgi:uncharacterized protein (TIGR02996 family)
MGATVMLLCERCGAPVAVAGEAVAVLCAAEGGGHWPLYPGERSVGRAGTSLRPDIAIEHGTVSMRQAVMRCEPRGISVMDVRSTAGTYVNGRRSDPDVATALSLGDTIRFSGFTCHLSSARAPSAHALDGVLQTLATGDAAAALRQLVAAWRALGRPVAVSRLVEALEARLPAARSPTMAGWVAPDDGDDDGWQARLARADDVELGGLCAAIPRAPSAAAARERLRAAFARAPHPCLAVLIEEVVRSASYADPDVWWLVRRAIIVLGDPRLLGLGALIDQLGHGAHEHIAAPLTEAVESLARHLPPDAREPPIVAQSAIERLTAAIGEPPARPRVRRDRHAEAQLLAAVYADPDRDEPRWAYADWLQDRGEPYGAVVATELGGPPSGHVGELLALGLGRHVDHGKRRARDATFSGSGTLATLFRRVASVRGFPGDVWPRTDYWQQQRLGAHPGWATVYRVRFPGLVDEPQHLGPAMTSLRWAGRLSDKGVDALCASPTRWERLVRLDLGEVSAVPIERLAACALLPALRQLGAGSHWRWITRAAWARQLEEIALSAGDDAEWLELTRTQPRLRRLRVIAGAVTLTFTPAEPGASGGGLPCLEVAAATLRRAPNAANMARAVRVVASLPRDAISRAVLVDRGRYDAAGIALALRRQRLLERPP